MGNSCRNKSKCLWLFLRVLIICFTILEVRSKRLAKPGNLSTADKKQPTNDKADHVWKYITYKEASKKSKMIQLQNTVTNMPRTGLTGSPEIFLEQIPSKQRVENNGRGYKSDTAEEISDELTRTNGKSSSGKKAKDNKHEIEDTVDSHKRQKDKSGQRLKSYKSSKVYKKHQTERSSKKSATKFSYQSNNSKPKKQSPGMLDTITRSVVSSKSTDRRIDESDFSLFEEGHSKLSDSKQFSVSNIEYKSDTEDNILGEWTTEHSKGSSEKKSKDNKHIIEETGNSHKRQEDKSKDKSKSDKSSKAYKEKNHSERSSKKSATKSNYKIDKNKAKSQSPEMLDTETPNVVSSKSSDRGIEDFSVLEERNSGTPSLRSGSKMRSKMSGSASDKQLAESSAGDSYGTGVDVDYENKVPDQSFAYDTSSLSSYTTTSYSQTAADEILETTTSTTGDFGGTVIQHSQAPTSDGIPTDDEHLLTAGSQTEGSDKTSGLTDTEKAHGTELEGGWVTYEDTEIKPTIVIKPPYPYVGVPTFKKRPHPCCVDGKLELNFGTFHRKGGSFGELEGVATKITDTPQSRFIRCSFGAEIKVSFESMGNADCFGCTNGPFCGRRMLQLDFELSQNKRRNILFEITDDEHLRNGGAFVLAKYPNITIFPRNSFNNETNVIQIQGGVNAYTNRVTLFIGNQFIRVTNDKRLDENFCHSDLFHLNGQLSPKSGGMSSNTVTIRINRLTSDTEDYDSFGVCAATLQWVCPWQES